MNKPLKLLFISAFFNALCWMILIPIWQYPDEQAHFAQVQNVAELGKVPTVGNNTSYEIALSEKILGTDRNGFGNNKYTYHPEYNIPYSENSTGLFEKDFSNLPQESRTDLVKREATLNPPLYYLLGSFAYRITFDGSLFDRIFAVRFLSALIFLATIFLAFNIGKIIFRKDKFLPIILTLLISFMPMLVFSSTGILPDPLTNLLFTLVLFLSLKLIKSGFNKNTLILTCVTIFLGVLTRQQFLISLLIVLLAIVYNLVKKPQFIKITLITLVIFTIFIIISNTLAVGLPIITNFRIAELSSLGIQQFTISSFANYFVWTLKHTFAEVWPWYWGVYKWLSLTLPPVYYQIINRLVIVALFGVLLKIIADIKSKKFKQESIYFYTLIIVSAIYFLIMTLWDYFFHIKNGYSFGIQGRYFFSLIVAHLAILLTGLQYISRVILKKYSKYAIFTTAFVMIIFNDLTLYHVSGSYYDTSSLHNFIIQASQYKPTLLKGPTILLIVTVNLTLQSCLVYYLGKYVLKKVN